MIRIHALAMASLAVAAVVAVNLHQPVAKAQDYTAPVTKPLNHDDRPLGEQFFHVEWGAAPGRRGQDHITGYVYNDFGDYATNVALRITELDSIGGEVGSIVQPVGSVPGFGRAYLDVYVPRSPSYRVAVTAFDFVAPRGAK